MTSYETAIELAAKATLAGLPPRAWEYLEQALALRGAITDDRMVSRAVTLDVLSDVIDCVAFLLREELSPQLQAAVPELAVEIGAAIDTIVRELTAGIEDSFPTVN